MAVACSRPGSWEQFVRAEDAPGGVYEFVIPSSSVIPSEAKESTFNLTFYTSPLDEPLQLEVTWLYSTAEVFPVSQKHGHQEQKPREIVPGPPSDRDTGNTFTAPVFSETVWFPAGEHRALYRSGVSLVNESPLVSISPATSPATSPAASPAATSLAGPSPISAENGEGAAVLPPTFPNSEQNRGRCQEKDGDLPQKEVKTGKVIVKPINPPEDFRGLGIIWKINDGTR